MCFGSSPPPPASTPAAAPPAPAPLAQAVSPTTSYQNETIGKPGYNASGVPLLLRDPSIQAHGAGAGVGGSTGAGLGQM